MKTQKRKAKQTIVNPAIEAMFNRLSDGKSLTASEQLKMTWDEPRWRAQEALDDLYLQAKGIEWRSRYHHKDNPKLVQGGDPVAIQAYVNLLREHVCNLNLLARTHRDLLRPVSRNCFSWPMLIAKRRNFGDDADKLIQDAQVGADTIVNDPAARFDPTKRFGKVAWNLIQRIEHYRAMSPEASWASTFRPQESWADKARTLPPFKRKASPDDRREWIALVNHILEEDLRDPDKRKSYYDLIKAPSHQHRRKAVFLDKIRGEFDSLWRLHAQ